MSKSAGHRLELVETLRAELGNDAGIRMAYERIPALVRSGLFEGTVWDDPASMYPPLVKHSLLGPEPSSLLEAASELRMVALANGKMTDSRLSAAGAKAFVEEAVALNLDLLQMGASEEHRLASGPVLDRARRVVRFVADSTSLARLKRVLLDEINALCHQRRIMTAAAVDMIHRAEAYADPEGNRVERRLAGLSAAIHGVTAMARRYPSHDDYRAALEELERAELEVEARAFGKSLRDTGLSSPQHAVLLRHAARERKRKVIGLALGLGPVGRAELGRHEALVRELVDGAVTSATPMAIGGLAGVLERALLSAGEVVTGLCNLLRYPPSVQASQRLLAARPFEQEPAAPGPLLLAGALAVLGNPLGIGQGEYPTCQAARGLSLWSQVAPGYFLELLTSAAFDDCARVRFRGVELCSRDQPQRPLATDLRLDPASAVLVPHIDGIYRAMLEAVAHEPGDPHRYVNPGLYGPWVPTGFDCLLDRARELRELADFIRRFIAVYHPEVDAVEPIHPRPLGLVVTSARGAFLGFHAISLQRVARGPSGQLRAYFYNPNDDGRQDWGQDILPSTSGAGEEPGESSLPFAELASRIYAFHYQPHEMGDLSAVPSELVEHAAQLARASWAPALLV